MRHVLTMTLTMTSALGLAAPAQVPASAAPAAPAARPAAAAEPHQGRCARGELCLWTGENHTGHRYAYDLSTADVESCVPLPGRAVAKSLANRTGRPVTTYQSRECATEGDFETYPGSGNWTPESPYAVRAFQIQQH
ncbi:hypothetical protein GQS52_19500 [Streptomyces sp. SCUT-3]|uniref:peptidase inhibitor family I36 protein n=1 Tax=Streptomyces TaxID=1883 RepID=UPI0015F82EEC|nr:peptidase inhibitor family I36 protein [Streptomyces sp. SCUT-3]QMV23597.1 hypothetical protein GQS52_19500 [Streptomyces sp. SCUT-3]